MKHAHEVRRPKNAEEKSQELESNYDNAWNRLSSINVSQDTLDKALKYKFLDKDGKEKTQIKSILVILGHNILHSLKEFTCFYFIWFRIADYFLDLFYLSSSAKKSLARSE